MALTYTPTQLLQGTALTNGLVTEYTVPINTTTILKEITLCNTDTVVRLVTLHIIPSAGAAGASNIILNALPVQPGETKIIPMSRVMPNGYFIQAKADAGSVVSLNMSGIQVT